MLGAMSLSMAKAQKFADPEGELNNAQMTFKKLSPQCSVAKRALGIPQLAPQEKQLAILSGELDETKLCISMSSKGRHALRDKQMKRHILTAIEDADELSAELRQQRLQLLEVDCLNYLTQKKLLDLNKMVRSEADELANVENALNRLKQFENRLELATKRFCVVNYDNSLIRLEIHRLLVERNNFNLQWSRTINKLVKGKIYLLDILEVAARVFADRDGYRQKLNSLKWKGLYGLNRDIAEMQQFDYTLNHLSKLEEFLRVKGSKRICESDEREERERLEEIERCKAEIAQLEKLLNGLFEYSKLDLVPSILASFNRTEIANFSKFQLLSKVLQETVVTRSQVVKMHKLIFNQRDTNQKRTKQQQEHLATLHKELLWEQGKTKTAQVANKAMTDNVERLLNGIQELSSLTGSDVSSITTMLGPKRGVTIYNYRKYLMVLEKTTEMLIEVAYGEITPPTPTPRRGGKPSESTKLVGDPYIEILRPNKIQNIVDYLPCAYCVEDYMMNLVFEKPAKVATDEYLEEIFHLEDVNTKFGIYSLTLPSKRHPFRGTNKE